MFEFLLGGYAAGAATLFLFLLVFARPRQPLGIAVCAVASALWPVVLVALIRLGL